MDVGRSAMSGAKRHKKRRFFIMKRFFTIFLTSLLVLSLVACGGENNDNGKTVDLTAQEVLDKLKTALGDSYECDVTDEQSWLSDYFGLDLSKIDSGVSESSSISAMNPSTAVVLKVKDGYAKDAAALLQERFAQVEDYSQLYSMNQAQVGQARLFVSGDYVALLILGQTPEEELTADAESQWFHGEGSKVDAAWKDIFGAADNQIVLK
jgi:hypothetical protein